MHERTRLVSSIICLINRRLRWKRAVCFAGWAEVPRAGEVLIGAPSDNERAFTWSAPGLSVEELLEAKGTPPLASAADLAADTILLGCGA